MNKSIEIPANVTLFKNIDKANLHSMLDCLGQTTREYKKNSYVYTSGDLYKTIGVVLSGKVHIVKEDFWGNRTIMKIAQVGDSFGEANACIENNDLAVSVVAAEDSLIMLLDFRRIVTTCSNACSFHQKLINNLMLSLALNNLQLNQKIEHMSQKNTREKLLSYLSQEAIKARCNNIYIPFNRQELADFLNVERSAMSKELCKMRDDGLLDFEKNNFILHKGNGCAFKVNSNVNEVF